MHLRLLLFVCAAWFTPPALSEAAGDAISGTVRDAQGRVVADATITVLTGSRAAVATTSTNQEGHFAVSSAADGAYLVVVTKGAFAEARAAVTVAAGTATPLNLTLEVAAITDLVTVTASRDSVEIVGRSGQPVNVITDTEIADRAKVVVAQAVEGEAGVALQRTSPSMAGVFIRGLVGNKVNVFVDGVRYSNGAQRGGVNTFLDLVEAGGLEGIEILRGPSSDQYGSDALGGSIQFLTKMPEFSASGVRVGGSVRASGGTAHRNGGGNAFGSVMGPRFGLTGTVSGRSAGLLRPGGGIDSHAAVTRFLGVRSDQLMDARLPNTSFRQIGESVRAIVAPTTSTRFTAGYTRSDQNGADRYDQLLGGDGNLISELNGLSLDLFTARLEHLGGGPFQHVALTYGLNSQREERVNQGGQGSNTAAIGHEPERTTSHSVALTARRELSSRASVSIGGDVQVEELTSNAFNLNPVTGARSVRRPRVPSGATFTQGGVFAQAGYDVVPDTVRVVGAVRVGGASYTAQASDAPVVNGAALWPDDALDAKGVGFRAAIVVTPSPQWTLSGLVSRGFRAPHMTDLGTLGLTGSGFEVAAADLRASGLSGSVGTTADAAAVSTGDPVDDVGPETSLNVEGTVAYHRGRLRSELTVFVNNVHDNIQKVALILPAGAVGTSLGGTPITAQTASGAVFVAASTVPVLVRDNFDNARIWGLEHALTATLGHGVMARTAFTYLHAADTATGLAPNIEGGTPQPALSAMARWTSTSGRFYAEPYLQA
ncbi:MAG: TonB-dependent receptor, partial [Acidobacteriota bacterium]